MLLAKACEELLPAPVPLVHVNMVSRVWWEDALRICEGAVVDHYLNTLDGLLREDGALLDNIVRGRTRCLM